MALGVQCVSVDPTAPLLLALAASGPEMPWGEPLLWAPRLSQVAETDPELGDLLRFQQGLVRVALILMLLDFVVFPSWWGSGPGKALAEGGRRGESSSSQSVPLPLLCRGLSPASEGATS